MNLSAVLLAGGESRRMGEDKATVLFEGVPLWQRQLDLLRQMKPDEILISSRTDPAWRPRDTTFVPDTPSSRGPLSGLAAALAIMRGTHLLALAVDMPLITSVQLSRLNKFTASGCGVAPGIASRAEPLAAIYPKEALPFVSAALEGVDYSLQALIEKLVNAKLLVVVQVPERETEFYRSMNAPGDLNLGLRFSKSQAEARANSERALRMRRNDKQKAKV